MTSPMVPGPMRPVTRPILPVRLLSTSLRMVSLCPGSGGWLLGILAVLQRGPEGGQVVACLRQDPAKHLVDALAAVQDGHLPDVREGLSGGGNDGGHVFGELLGDDRVLVGGECLGTRLDAVR